MRYAYYTDIGIAFDYEVFDFVSTGINGSIYKRVVFTYIFQTEIYNLAFGDVLENGEIDDFSISDNKDMAKILSTISRIVKLFLDKYPNRKVFFSGSSPERTRLYRMAIGNNLEELSEIYDINAVLKNGDIVEFRRNLACVAFLIGIKS